VAKTSKSAKSDRQKVIDDIRRKQKGAEKRQGMMIVGICVVVALLIVGVAAYNPVRTAIEKARYAGTPLDEIGANAGVCGEITEKEATGSGEHVPTGTQVEYDEAPPAFGSHWNEAGVAPDPAANRYYTADGRPELESLVHNLEHGYTILWYDETAAEDSSQIAAIKAMAAALDDNDTNGRLKFKAVPWTKDDGEAFPKGQHIAFTHWRVDSEAQKQYGIWQYCSEPSGEALEKFMDKYPFTDAPEPYVP
jgi:hypothetical protein